MDEGVVLGRNPDGGDVALSYGQRRQHTYVIGVNGTGKTTLLRQIAFSDMRQEPKHGLCVIDPHGDLIDDIMALVPEERVDDVILFDPSDEANPFSLNVFAPVPAEEIPRVASEIAAIFRKIFGRGWTPEMEGVIQNVTLTLLSRPADYELEEGKPWVAAMDEIPALLAMERVPDEDREKPPWKRKVETYRSQFYHLLQARDQIPVWEFWNYNFDTLTPRPRSELTLAVLNQVRRFLANPVVRNIVAQTDSKLDLSQVMNEGRILLVNLSKGNLGEANSAFLGSVVVAKLVVAVFARSQIEPAKRKPFHIIVDEFQNFAISSFPNLLSEGRKYNVDLVIAHQYREQLRDWVQGATVNAGNTICFRVGGDDAMELAREFDATPPPGETEFRARYARHILLRAPLGFNDEYLFEKGSEAMNRLAKLVNRERVQYHELEEVRRWLSALYGALQRVYRPEDLSDVLETISSLEGGATTIDDGVFEQIQEFWTFLRDQDGAQESVRADGYLQERVVYPKTPGTYHRSWSESRSEGGTSYSSGGSESSESGPIFDRVRGRPRPYSDVYQEIANNLTHLPNFRARCRLAGSSRAIVEETFRTTPWPEYDEDRAKRAELRNRNLVAIRKKTRRDFTRPRKKIEREFKARYETMLRSIGMSWKPDQPLPKPQVLLESED